MSVPVHFRYAWVAPDALTQILAEDTQLFAVARARAEFCAASHAADASTGGALARLRACARAPKLREFPDLRFCENAQAHAERCSDDAGAKFAEAAAALARALEALRTTDPARRAEEDAALLEGFATTDFPVLLLWSAPEAARRIFSSGGQRFSASVLGDSRERRRVAMLALRYAFAALGRLAPRDGWVGAGFGVTSSDVRYATIKRKHERFFLEPDLSLLAPLLHGKARIEAGESAFDHALRRADSQLRALLEAARAEADALGDSAWCYEATDAFLRRTERFLPSRCGRHGWWITRLCMEEVLVPESLAAETARALAARRDRERARGRSTMQESGPRQSAWPRRIALAAPQAVRLAATEYDDWVVDVERALSVSAPVEGTPAGAAVVQTGPDGLRFRFVEPNPRRTSDRYAALIPKPPLYMTADDAPGFAAPYDLIDNRLLRPLSNEVEYTAAQAGVDVMLRAPLMAAAMQPLLEREFASPRYTNAPDLTPLWWSEAISQRVTFGELERENCIWLLTAQDARSAAAALKTAENLAALYLLEIAEGLGAPRWIDLIADGARARLLVAGVGAFTMMLHAFACAEAPIALVVPGATPNSPPFCDDGGRALVADIYVPIVGPASRRPMEERV